MPRGELGRAVRASGAANLSNNREISAYKAGHIQQVHPAATGQWGQRCHPARGTGHGVIWGQEQAAARGLEFSPIKGGCESSLLQ